MEKTDLYYKPSGTISPVGVIAAMIVGGIAAATLAFLYAYAIWYIPFVYVNFIFTALLGFGTGMAVGMTMHFTKQRSNKIAGALGAFMGVVALYFAWVFWFRAVSEGEMMLFNPGELFSMMGIVGQEGVWGFSESSTVSGVMLYIIWAIEAIVIIVATFMGALGGASIAPFCENCNKWTKENVLVPMLQATVDRDGLVRDLEKQNLDSLKQLKRGSATLGQHFKVTAHSCNSCDKTHYLTIEWVKKTRNRKGEEETETEMLVDKLILQPSTWQDLSAWVNTL